jgi:hypothetical protein
MKDLECRDTDAFYSNYPTPYPHFKKIDEPYKQILSAKVFENSKMHLHCVKLHIYI